MDNFIKYLIDNFSNKKNSINHQKIKSKKYKHILSKLVSLTSFLPTNINLKFRFKYIKNGLTAAIKCKNTNCNNIIINIDNTYCTSLCATTDKSFIEKMTNTWKNKDKKTITLIQNKRKQTNIIKYGVDIASKLPEIIEKNKKTHFTNWGDYATNIKSIKDKRKNTCNIKYGGVGFASSSIFDKIKNTNKKLYGVEYFSSTKEWYDKCTDTCLKKFNKKWISHVDEINMLQQSGGYSWYDFKFPSGKTCKVQGYEPIILTDLLLKYDESDIIVGTKNIINEIGIFHYSYNGKQHRYYPDIYIKSRKLVIEVKSQYTFNKEIEKNLLKQECVLNQNYNFEFRIITP